MYELHCWSFSMKALYFIYLCPKCRGKVIYLKDHKASAPVVKVLQPSGNTEELQGENLWICFLTRVFKQNINSSCLSFVKMVAGAATSEATNISRTKDTNNPFEGLEVQIRLPPSSWLCPWARHFSLNGS